MNHVSEDGTTRTALNRKALNFEDLGSSDREMATWDDATINRTSLTRKPFLEANPHVSVAHSPVSCSNLPIWIIPS